MDAAHKMPKNTTVNGTSRSGTRRLSPLSREIVRFDMGNFVPMVEARFRKTKLNRNGPELSEAMLVPPENVLMRRPPLDDR